MTQIYPGLLPTSPTTPTSLSHSAMPQSATSCVVVQDGTGSSFDMLNFDNVKIVTSFIRGILL